MNVWKWDEIYAISDYVGLFWKEKNRDGDSTGIFEFIYAKGMTFQDDG